MTELRTARLVLRRAIPDDLEAMHASRLELDRVCPMPFPGGEQLKRFRRAGYRQSTSARLIQSL